MDTIICERLSELPERRYMCIVAKSLDEALATYRHRHDEEPVRVFVHKSYYYFEVPCSR